jgi:hypothetical protein
VDPRADWTGGPLAHLPSGSFPASAAWLALAAISGLALLRALAGKTGLTGGLSRALASRRLLVHDRGRVLADLACAIAGGPR